MLCAYNALTPMDARKQSVAVPLKLTQINLDDIFKSYVHIEMHINEKQISGSELPSVL